MNWNASLTTSQINTIFADEVKSAGGKVTDTFDDGTVLFSRAVLPQHTEVARKDRIDKGVAIKAAWEDVWAHPYVLRKVCVNGALVAQAVATKHVVNAGDVSPVELEISLREAIQMCAAEQDFEEVANKLRRTRSFWVRPPRALMPHLASLPADQATEIVEEIYRRFTEEADESRYGLINAVTSLARDTRNPELRWTLEKIGGALIWEDPPKSPGTGAAEAEAIPSPKG